MQADVESQENFYPTETPQGEGQEANSAAAFIRPGVCGVNVGVSER